MTQVPNKSMLFFFIFKGQFDRRGYFSTGENSSGRFYQYIQG
jgi:hypothetical protein